MDKQMWRVERSEATGRWFVVRGYRTTQEIWTNSYGASDFCENADARAMADVLNANGEQA